MLRVFSRRASLAMAIGMFAAVTAAASDLSFTGSFATDDALQDFQFVAASADVTIQTWGYGGGTNAASNSIPAGGFEPILTLFDESGGSTLNPNNELVDTTYPSGSCPPTGNTDPVSGACLDVFLSESSLTPGDAYLVVLTEVDNGPLGTTLGDGFSETGNGDFTGSEDGCSNEAFCDEFGNNRTGAWAVDIDGVTSAQQLSEPEPATALMVFTALGGVLLLRRRKAGRAK
jgi:hypothetical protein